MNIPFDPWYMTPIVIRRGSDYGYSIYVTTLPIVRQSARGILTILRAALERRVSGRKS